MIPDSEALERAALEDLHDAATSAERKALGLQPRRIGTAFVSIGARLPASAIVVNRTIGLGVGAADTRDTVEAVVAAYREAGVARYFVHLHPQAQPPALAGWLEGAGLVGARAWQKFERAPEPIEARTTDLDIREVGREQGRAFGEIACAGFDLGHDAVPWLARLPGRAGWHVFMSFDHGRPAGIGALFVRDGLAWFDFGVTVPEFRGRGSQGAILARRVQHARELGCRKLYTGTGVQVPGDPQHSYRNIVRTGFREDHVRENFAPPKA